MASTIYLLYYMVQKTSFEITLKFLYGLMYGIKEAIQPYMSYVWFLRNIYGGHPGKKHEWFYQEKGFKEGFLKFSVLREVNVINFVHIFEFFANFCLYHDYQLIETSPLNPK